MHHRRPSRSLILFYVNCLLLGMYTGLVFVNTCMVLVAFLRPNSVLLICRYCPVGRSFYSPDLGRRQPLGEGLESWRGFYQSIRPTQMGLSLNIGIVFYIFFLDAY